MGNKNSQRKVETKDIENRDYEPPSPLTEEELVHLTNCINTFKEGNIIDDYEEIDWVVEEFKEGLKESNAEAISKGEEVGFWRPGIDKKQNFKDYLASFEKKKNENNISSTNDPILASRIRGDIHPALFVLLLG